MESKKKVAVVVVALLVLLAALLWVLLPDRQWAPNAETTPARSTPAPRHEVAPEAIPMRGPPPLAQMGGPAQAPIIDEVTLEKSRVCEGEENLVTVKAHTPDNVDDDYLQVAIDGQLGFQVPLKGRKRDVDEIEPVPRMISVIGRNGATTEVEVPPFEVDNCVVPRQVRIKWRMLPNGHDERELHATVFDLAAPEPIEILEWRWDFGDGSHEITQSPIVVHDFGGREQDVLTSTYLVTATAVGPDEQVVGRTSIAIRNRAFELLAHKGAVLIETRMSPRFPELNDRGTVEQEVRLWHAYDQPVTLTRVTRRRYHDQGSREGDRVELSPAELFGTTTLDRLQVAGADMTLEPHDDDSVAFDLYTVEGVSADGRRAGGTFTVMVPPRLPTEDDSDPVNDSMLAAKIIRAQELLGRAYVTDEDLFRLERDGKFQGLQPVADLAIRPPPPDPKSQGTH